VRKNTGAFSFFWVVLNILAFCFTLYSHPKSLLLILLHKTALVCAFLLAFGTGRAQTDWKLKAESGGIKIFMAPVAASRVKALKVECSFNATPAQLVAVILDLDACSEWVYRSKSNILLKRISPSELYYYSEVDIPWPANNRDFIAHLIVRQDKKSKVVTVDAPCVPDLVPEKKDIVRIRQASGRWTITPVNKTQVKIEYVLVVDPGGSIPAWIVNMFAAKGPMESFKKLRLQLQKPAYKNVHFDFITD
jgi:hypothetical protein